MLGALLTLAGDYFLVFSRAPLSPGDAETANRLVPEGLVNSATPLLACHALESLTSGPSGVS